MFFDFGILVQIFTQYSVDLEQTSMSTLQWITGATGLVSFGGEPAHVPDVLRSGEPVVIDSGPLAGYEAIFDTRLPGTERVRVLLKLLRNRQMPVDLPAGQVRPKK